MPDETHAWGEERGHLLDAVSAGRIAKAILSRCVHDGHFTHAVLRSETDGSYCAFWMVDDGSPVSDMARRGHFVAHCPTPESAQRALMISLLMAGEGCCARDVAEVLGWPGGLRVGMGWRLRARWIERAGIILYIGGVGGEVMGLWPRAMLPAALFGLALTQWTAPTRMRTFWWAFYAVAGAGLMLFPHRPGG